MAPNWVFDARKRNDDAFQDALNAQQQLSVAFYFEHFHFYSPEHSLFRYRGSIYHLNLCKIKIQSSKSSSKSDNEFPNPNWLDWLHWQWLRYRRSIVYGFCSAFHCIWGSCDQWCQCWFFSSDLVFSSLVWLAGVFLQNLVFKRKKLLNALKYIFVFISRDNLMY